MYGDKITRSMQKAIDETDRRRVKQLAFNEKHGITPTGIDKRVRDLIEGVFSEKEVNAKGKEKVDKETEIKSESDLMVEMKRVEKRMREAAKNLEFEKAAEYRDTLKSLKTQFISGAPI
jgi:excinuclease ABC subunit B